MAILFFLTWLNYMIFFVCILFLRLALRQKKKATPTTNSFENQFTKHPPHLAHAYLHTISYTHGFHKLISSGLYLFIPQTLSLEQSNGVTREPPLMHVSFFWTQETALYINSLIVNLSIIMGNKKQFYCLAIR